MTLKMGPVLSFRGWEVASQLWSLSALIVAEGPPGALTWTHGQSQGTADAEELWTVGTLTAWRFHFGASLAQQESFLDYQILGRSNRVWLPEAGSAPRLAYASCAGFSDAKDMKRVADKNAMWRAMSTRYVDPHCHLLLLGGDQVYSDSMWTLLPSLRAWSELDFEAANDAVFTDEMARELPTFFFDLYASRWAQPEVAAMLASIPTVAMWDDHDILDGWGSYPERRQACGVFAGIWPIARRAFEVFQQQLAPGEARPGSLAPSGGPMSFGLVLPHIAILALDMRSQRSASQVIHPDHWTTIFQWMNGLPDEVSHLLVMSSIPVIYPGFDTLERLLGALPGLQELEDDLRDHWRSRSHKGERCRLVHRLLACAQTKKVRPTILSGDVHVAALGVIESIRDARAGDRVGIINQLISSGVVHPAPPAAVLFALRNLFDSNDELDSGITARMVEFPGTQERFIGRRNFLSIEPDPPNRGLRPRLWANWIVEGEAEPYVKVIHPV